MVVKHSFARDDHPLCVECGYDIVGLPTGLACPECGMVTAVALRDPKYWRRRHGARTPLMALAAFSVLWLIAAPLAVIAVVQLPVGAPMCAAVVFAAIAAVGIHVSDERLRVALDWDVPASLSDEDSFHRVALAAEIVGGGLICLSGAGGMFLFVIALVWVGPPLLGWRMRCLTATVRATEEAMLLPARFDVSVAGRLAFRWLACAGFFGMPLACGGLLGVYVFAVFLLVAATTTLAAITAVRLAIRAE
jgi:hypothetical protein